MDILVHRESFIEHWRDLLRIEEKTGQIPLPALDSLLWENGRPLNIALVAPGIAPESPHVFVDLARMPPALLLTVGAILQVLTRQVATTATPESADLVAILHQGGLGYEFHFATGPAVELRSLPASEQALAWAMLEAITLIAAQYPDLSAYQVESSAGEMGTGTRRRKQHSEYSEPAG